MINDDDGITGEALTKLMREDWSCKIDSRKSKSYFSHFTRLGSTRIGTSYFGTEGWREAQNEKTIKWTACVS